MEIEKEKTIIVEPAEDPFEQPVETPEPERMPTPVPVEPQKVPA